MGRAQGARALQALAFESTYGVAPGSGFIQMPFARTTLGADQPLESSELLGQGRDPLDPTKGVITAGGQVTVPVDVEAFGHWLKSVFGAPTTTGTGPYTHVFQSGAWTLPSYSVENGFPDVPSFSMVRGCMTDKLSIPMGREGNLVATVDVIAQGENDPTPATTAGTPSPITVKRFGHFNGVLQREGSSFADVTGAEFMYSNNLDPVDGIGAEIDGIDPSVAAATGKLDVRFANEILLDQAIAGDPCSLQYGWTLASGESLTVDVHRVFLPRPKREIQGPQGVQVSFDWQAAKQTNGDPMVTVTLVNNVASY